MRIAGYVSKSQNIEVQYVRSVHTVSRWIHELFEKGDAAPAPPNASAPEAPFEAEAPRRRR